MRCQYWGVDLPADLWVDLPNLSSQTFRCGHHRVLFALHKTYEDQTQSATEASTIETICTANSNKVMNLSTSMDTIPKVGVSDLANLSADISIHHDAHDTPSLHGDLFQYSTQNEMLTHYNRVVIGCFKDFFQ